MIRMHLLVIMVVLGFVTLSACETLDEDLSVEDEMGVDEIEQAHTLTYTDKLIVNYGNTKADTLVNTSTYENIHRYKFVAAAGQKVTFVLEIPSSAGGAWLGLTSGSALPGFFTIYKAQKKSTTINRVYFEYKSTTNATYYLWVRQGIHATGSFAYKLGVAATMCATMSGSIYDTLNTPSSRWWTLFSAKNFPAGSTQTPGAWMPSVQGGTFQSSTRVVMLGTCTSNQATNCGVNDPNLTCEGDMLGYDSTDNTCTAQNLVLEDAGDDDGAKDGWYQAITSTSPCYGM